MDNNTEAVESIKQKAYSFLQKVHEGIGKHLGDSHPPNAHQFESLL